MNYQERITSELLAGPPRANLKICKMYLEIAKQGESASIRPFPGVLNPALMSRLTKFAGVRSVIIRNLSGMMRRAGLQSVRSAFRILPGLMETGDEQSVCGDGMRKPLIE